MLFKQLFAGLAALSFSMSAFASPAPVSPNVATRTTLNSRAVLADLCAQVDLNNVNIRTTLQASIDGLLSPLTAQLALNSLDDGILTFSLGLGTICVCADGDVLTTQSVLDAVVGISTTNGILTNLLNVLLGGLNLDAVILDTILASVQDQTSDGNSQCCPDGLILCNGSCADTCVSGVPGRKRSIKERSRFACRQPFTACPVSHFLARDTAASYGGGFECIDTTADLESCGGCINPFKGNVAGEDCTAITNVDSVACTVGKCVVESCAPGFVPSTDATSCVAKSLFSSSRLTVQSRKTRK